MACFKPIEGYRARAGGFTLNRTEAFVDQPMTISCGRCRGCRRARTESWGLRCMHEMKYHAENSFLTFTYDDYNLPAPNFIGENGYSVSSLEGTKKDLRTFFRKLRRYLQGKKIRYFAAGEYGPSTWRVHGHGILFGHAFLEDRYKWRTHKGNIYYRSPTLEKLWGKGIVEFCDANFQTAKYVAGYCLKKMHGDKAIEHYKRINPETGEVFNLEPEFMICSTRPGIGSRWFNDYNETDAYTEDGLRIMGSKRKFPIPKYYDKLKKRAEGDYIEALKKKRRKKLIDRRVIANNTPERLKVREEVAEARESLTPRMG